MSKKYSIILFIAFFSFLLTPAVFAWDDTGHKVSAYIAWQQMTPAARARTVKLLTGAPEDSHLGVYYLSGSRSAAAKELDLFMIASTWADIIRDRNFKVRFEKYNQGLWHYADIFWKQIGGKSEMMSNKSEGLAIVKLYDFEKNLKDSAISEAEKGVILAWFLHVGGDIHNPLHNASRITEIEPKGDQGGNLFLLSPADAVGGNRVNLHSYWDSILRRSVPRENDACDADYISSIADKITKKHSFSQMNGRLKLGNYKEWNAQGYALLNESVYTEELKRGELPAKKYQNRAFAAGQEQIALAGYRIAETLNGIFVASENMIK